MAILAEFRGALGELRCGASQRLVRLGVSMTQIHILSILEHHGEMAMSRVDRAEVVDVDHEDREGPPETLGTLELLGENRVEVTHVVEPGLRLDARCLDQAWNGKRAVRKREREKRAG